MSVAKLVGGAAQGFPYQIPICDDEPISQLRSFCCKAKCKRRSPIMSDNSHFLFRFRGMVAINAKPFSNRDYKFRQRLKNLRRSVAWQRVSPTIARKIRRNYSASLLYFSRREDVAPYCPAIRETMEEDNDRLLLRTGREGFRSIVGDVVEFKSIPQRYKLMCQTRWVLR